MALSSSSVNWGIGAVLRLTKHSSGSRDFYAVCTILVSLSNCFTRIVRPINNPLVRSGITHEVLSPAIRRVGMTTCSTDGFTRAENTRSYRYVLVIAFLREVFIPVPLSLSLL